MKKLAITTSIIMSCILWSCQTNKIEGKSEMQKKVDEFALVELKADINHLSEKEKQMLPLLFDAAKLMDDIYWVQAYGNKDELYNKIKDSALLEFVNINYGPWERLNGNKPFMDSVGEKPLGATFYPFDMTKEEFELFKSDDKTSQYTVIKRNSQGQLESIPYHIAYKEQTEKAAGLIKQASELAEDVGLKKYLSLRADALLTDNYFASDMAWMDMKKNNIDFVVGPIETYEDQLFGYKASHEAYILIKDLDWSNKLDRFAKLLPKLQESLPVEPSYKKEIPGADSDLGVYSAVYYAGDCNSGSKTIAINLPNDPKVHVQKGSRKLQLKNSMQYKFDKILLPIGNLLINPDQQKHIKFDAFFENVMFHEVAHGLGIKNLVNGKGTVHEALKDKYSGLEEGKADILGLYMVKQLAEMGEIQNKDLMDNYVTFIAGIFRSIRFGAASAHGNANMVCFNYLKEKEAFTRDSLTGTYKVDFEKMTLAMNSLVKEILTLQGDGNYAGVTKLFEEKALIDAVLQTDLDKIKGANIPRDIRFKQGKEVLGL